MALADPQTVTISTVAHPLARTGSGMDSSQYTSPEGDIVMSVSHAYNARTRRVVRLAHSKLVADAYNPTLNKTSTMSVYQVWDVPKLGYTIVEQKAVHDAFAALLAASSGAVVTQILGGVS